MNKLFVLGGASRTGKSTIIENLVRDSQVHYISLDAVQEGVRSLFVDDPYQILKSINYSGSADYITRDDGRQVTDKFDVVASEAEIAQRAVVGMLDHYRRNQLDVAIEGPQITPEWADRLKEISGFTLKAAFVGFLSANHAENVFKFARDNPHDWINEWMSRQKNPERELFAWMEKQAIKNQKLKEDAEALGYRFFDISAMQFDEYLSAVKDYLLSDES